MASQLDAITTKNLHGTLGGKLPSYLPMPGFFFNLDFFYWKGSEDGLSYGTDREVTGSGFEGKRKNLDFRWDPGFRVGLGYCMQEHDEWDLFLQLTYFHNEARGSERSHDISKHLIMVPWFPAILGGLAEQAFCPLDAQL